MFRQVLLTAILLLAALTACGGTREPAARPEEETAARLALTSAIFQEGGDIPGRHTCDGLDLSPPLSWSAPPDGAQSLALICDDPDAPVGTWVHWLLYDLPPDATALAEGIPAGEEPAGGGRQGRNSWGNVGYGGPCPPPGPAHRYFFTLYALNARLDLSAGATQKELLKAMDGHILAEGQLMGRYQK